MVEIAIVMEMYIMDMCIRCEYILGIIHLLLIIIVVYMDLGWKRINGMELYMVAVIAVCMLMLSHSMKINSNINSNNSIYKIVLITKSIYSYNQYHNKKQEQNRIKLVYIK